MTNNDFFDLAERLWKEWLAGSLTVPPFVRAHFDLEASPEPYLLFGSDENPLVVLTTNPGATMPHQLRLSIASGQGVARTAEPYAMAARRLAEWYQRELTGAAKVRLDSMLRLASAAGYSGAIQVELCPFHSAAFPRKARYAALVASVPLLAEYAQALRAFLETLPVLAVSAVSSRQPPDRESVQRSAWLTWKCEIMGLAVDRSEVVPLVENARGVTCAGLIDRRGQAPKALVLMMGGNHLPSRNAASLLVAALQTNGMT